MYKYLLVCVVSVFTSVGCVNTQVATDATNDLAEAWSIFGAALTEDAEEYLARQTRIENRRLDAAEEIALDILIENYGQDIPTELVVAVKTRFNQEREKLADQVEAARDAHRRRAQFIHESIELLRLIDTFREDARRGILPGVSEGLREAILEQSGGIRAFVKNELPGVFAEFKTLLDK